VDCRSCLEALSRFTGKPPAFRWHPFQGAEADGHFVKSPTRFLSMEKPYLQAVTKMLKNPEDENLKKRYRQIMLQSHGKEILYD
jgi:hypothetical protein